MVLAVPALARSGDGGSSSGELLRLGYGARVPALGGIMPAGARGIDAAWYNPAGLADMSGREIGGSYQSLAENIHAGSLGYAQPISEKIGMAGFVSYLDYGRQDRTTVTTAGAITTVNPSGSFSAADVVGGIALGRRFTEGLSAGAALKVFNSKLDLVSASALAVDLGAEYRIPVGFPLTLGGAVRNLGTRLKFDQVSEDLPLTFQFGLNANLFKDRFRLYAGGEQIRNEEVAFRGGIEAMPFGPILTLRAGYDGSHDVGSGLTAGIGIEVNNLVLDYAYIPFTDFGDNHRVGLTYRF